MSTAEKNLDRYAFWVAGERIRTRRKALGLTQRELGERLLKHGVSGSRPTVGNLERGMGLDLGKLLPLALALECSVTYLLGLTDQPAKWKPDLPLEEAATRVFLAGSSPRLRAIPGNRPKVALRGNARAG